MPARLVAAVLVLAAALGLWWWGHEPAPVAPPPSPLALTASGPLSATAFPLLPLPPAPTLPPARVALGQRLFSDPRLSHDNTVACASCHDLAHGGVDHRPTSIGVNGQHGSRNAPTVFNTSLNFVLFWDGRAATLEEQAAGPVHNPVEMASNWSEVVGKLSADPDYVQAFRAAYPDGLTGANIANAIATFERTLLTPGAALDRYLLGDRSALSARELAGMQRFIGYGCSSCHQGVGIGGNMFQRFGVMEGVKRPSNRDPGRFNVTRRPEDQDVFKVPMLRNVAVTGPYFHDATANTLDEAVVTMGRVQLGRELSKEDVALIVAFLRSLTGTWQGQTLQ